MRGRGRGRADARSGRNSVRQRRGRERRILLAALVVSTGLHLLLIGTIGDLLRGPPAPAAPRAEPIAVEAPPRGLRVVQVTPVADDAADEIRPDRPVRPEPDPSRERPRRAAPGPTADAAERADPVDDRSAADRLAPRLVDARLWRPMILIPREPTIQDVEARIAAAIELLNDSALADVERSVRARDWTVQDAQGGKWGISPGKLHLGSLTLPLPVAFASDPEAESRRSEWYDLEAQVDRAAFLESFEDRVKAIRERRERERSERGGKDGGTTGGGGA